MSTIETSQSMRVIDLGDGGHLVFFERWLGEAEAARLMEELTKDILWRQENISMFGKKVPQPRLTAAFADPGVSYRYSGLLVEPRIWLPSLAALRRQVERSAGNSFNYALANLYRDGSDSISPHADDEPELGMNPVIASVSLGATRRFVLRHKRDRRRREVSLAGGSLLVMAGTTQHHWLHEVPKTARPTGPRINLTFRRVGG